MVLFPQSPIRYDKFDSISLSMANASIGVNGAYSLAGELLCVNMSLVQTNVIRGNNKAALIKQIMEVNNRNL